MSDDEQGRKSTIEQSEVILKTDDRRRVFKSCSRDLDEALGGEREVPEGRGARHNGPRTRPDADATHDDESNSEDE